MPPQKRLQGLQHVPAATLEPGQDCSTCHGRSDSLNRRGEVALPSGVEYLASPYTACLYTTVLDRARCHQMASNWPPRQSPPSTAAMSCWLLRLRSAWRHRHVVSAHSWLLTRSCVIALRGLVRGHHGGRAAHGRSPRGRACYNWLSPYVGGRPKGHSLPDQKPFAAATPAKARARARARARPGPAISPAAPSTAGPMGRAPPARDAALGGSGAPQWHQF